MLSYVEYLNLPTAMAVALIALFLILQLIGEVLEVKGRAVPEFIKIRKYFARRKMEREVIQKMPDILENVQTLLDDVRSHYSEDNIMKRDKWIEDVNCKLKKNDELFEELNKKLDMNRGDLINLIIDNKRDTIINFAYVVADEDTFVTREQYNRIFKMYKEYEKIIKDNKLTNGEIDVAYRIINESYEHRMKTHTFGENLRGYDI
jgi:flagellin-specific chaperone FliS